MEKRFMYFLFWYTLLLFSVIIVMFLDKILLMHTLFGQVKIDYLYTVCRNGEIPSTVYISIRKRLMNQIKY